MSGLLLPGCCITRPVAKRECKGKVWVSSPPPKKKRKIRRERQVRPRNGCARQPSNPKGGGSWILLNMAPLLG